MQRNIITGSEFILYDIDQRPIALSKNCALSLKQSLIDTQTKDDLGWANFIGGQKDWNIDFDALVSYDEESSTDFFMSKLLSGEPFFIKFGVVQESFEYAYWGEVVVESIEISAPNDDVVSYEGKLTGVGELIFIDEGSPIQTGYLKVETDPVFRGSPAFGITNQNKLNWNLAYDKILQSIESTIVGDQPKLIVTLRDGSRYTVSLPADSNTGGGNGQPGKDGITYYPHIRWADSSTSGMSDNPTGKAYIGFAYTTSEIAPTNYNDYAWTLVKGADGKDGKDGIDGRNGIDGLNGTNGTNGIDGTRFHVAYANSANGTVGFNQTSGTYIGTYVDRTDQDSTDPARYNWVLLKGADGKDGSNGIAGLNGEDGRTSYLHIRYSNNAGISFSPTPETAGDYLGQYTDYIEADSDNPAVYAWTKIKGDKGEVGNEGIQGIQGASIFGGKPFDAGRQYTMTLQRQEIVKYNGVFYATKKGTGNIPVGALPTDSNYWELMNSYSNVATDILLANDAYIGALGTGKLILGDGITNGWVMSEASIKSIQTNDNGTARTSLTTDGRLFSNNADITGNINASTLTTNSGTIGGISITNNGISAPNFSIDKNGIANFTNAVISGSINAQSGSIGNFSFNASNTGLNGQKLVVDGSIGAIWKNDGIADVRGGHLILPLTKPANPVNGSVWLSDVLGDGGTPMPGSGGGSLSTLSDVLLSSASNGQALVFNGTKWVNQSVVTDLSGYIPWTSATENVTGSSVIRRNGSGHAFASYFNSTDNVETTGLGYLMGKNTTDAYHRSFTAGAVQGWLGLGSFAYKSSIQGSEIITNAINASADIGVSQMIRWRNYGNGHIIFDASSATAPDGSAIDRINPTYTRATSGANTPVIMGWNGSATYGVRVDEARTAESSPNWTGYDGNLFGGNPLYMMGFNNGTGKWMPTQTGQVQSWLGLGSGAYTDKTQLWSTSHPNDFYVSTAWDGTYWNFTSNHGAPVRVGYANNSNGWAGQTYATNDVPVNQYLMAYGNDGQYHPSNAGNVQAFLGLNNGSTLNNTAEYSNRIRVLDSTDRNANTILPQENPNRVRFDFVNSASASTNANYAGVMTFSPWVGTTASTGDASYQLAFGSTGINGSGVPLLNIRKGIDSTWNGWYHIYTSADWAVSVGVSANSVVQRDGNGYINNGWFNSSRGDENSGAASYLYDTGDGYMRKKSTYNASYELINGQNYHFQMRNSGGGTAYNNGTLELQSSNSPTLGLHWEGVVASTIGIEAGGRIAIRNNPGTGYESLVAYNLNAANDVTGQNGYFYTRLVIPTTRPANPTNGMIWLEG